MKSIDAILRFVTGFTIPTLLLRRRVHFPKKRGRETLAEHLVQLLYFAEFFVKKFELPYDLHKIREYILAHDMAEPATQYAKRNGFDICRFHASPDLIRHKKELEAQALQVQKRQFPELAELVGSAERYDAQGDAESRFVKAIDVLVPTLNIMLDGGRTHHIDDISLGMWRTDREWRIKLDSHVWRFYKDEVLPRLIEREQELFNPPKQRELELS